VLFLLLHLALRRLSRVFAGSPAVTALKVENAVLRHQLRVLRRTVKRPPFESDHGRRSRGWSVGWRSLAERAVGRCSL